MEFLRRRTSDEQLNEEAIRVAQGHVAYGKDLIRLTIESGAAEPGAVRLHEQGQRVQEAFQLFRAGSNLAIVGIDEQAQWYKDRMQEALSGMSIAEQTALLRLATGTFEQLLNRRDKDQ